MLPARLTADRLPASQQKYITKKYGKGKIRVFLKAAAIALFLFAAAYQNVFPQRCVDHENDLPLCIAPIDVEFLKTLMS
jgi:hypothetical protein